MALSFQWPKRSRRLMYSSARLIQLPVVPVVQPQGHNGNEAVEHPALDAPGGQLLVVVPGEAEDAAHIVIDQPDLHALGGLLLQNVQDAVPKDAGLEDEVLQEDEPLCLLQLDQHLPELVLA